MVDMRRVLGGRYWLSAGLGQGSVAEVYRALDLELGRPVAIKRLKPEFAGDPHARASMAREAHLISQVEHPGVVRLLDVGETQAGGAAPALPYLVLELVPGRTLQSLVANGAALEPAHACGIAANLLDALACCHAAGVLHRDIKPANVVLTDTGGLKLVDFGIACLLSEAPAAAAAGVRGTVRYVAPERLCGAPTDIRSDLYSVGALLYQLLLGRPPFVGDVPTVVREHLYGDPVRPSRLDPSLGEGFDQVLLTALAKDPADRYASADAMATALAQLGVGQPAAPLPRLDAAVLALVPAAAGGRAVAARPARSRSRSAHRRQAVLAGALAAALLPAVGFLVRSNEVGGGDLRESASAAVLPSSELAGFGAEHPATASPGTEDGAALLQAPAAGSAEPADGGGVVESALLARSASSAAPRGGGPASSRPAGGSSEGGSSSPPADGAVARGVERQRDVVPGSGGDGPDPGASDPGTQEPTAGPRPAEPAAGRPPSQPPRQRPPVATPPARPSAEPARPPVDTGGAEPRRAEESPAAEPPRAPGGERPPEGPAPNRPDEPARPSEPAKPVKTAKPTEPAQPVRPSKPEKPDTPVRPDKPKKDDKPDKPKKDDGPDEGSRADGREKPDRG